MSLRNLESRKKGRKESTEEKLRTSYTPTTVAMNDLLSGLFLGCGASQNPSAFLIILVTRSLAFHVSYGSLPYFSVTDSNSNAVLAVEVYVPCLNPRSSLSPPSLHLSV